MPPVRTPPIPFRLKLLLGVLVIAGAIVLLMTVFLRDALRASVAETLATSMATAAAGVAISTPPQDIDRIAAAATDPDPDTIARLRRELSQHRDRFIALFPGEWSATDPETRQPDLLIVIPDADSGRILVATDARMEGQEYRFDPALPASERWSRMSVDTDVMSMPRGDFLGGRAPLASSAGGPPPALLVIEMSRGAFSAIADPLDMVVRILFVGFMSLLLIAALLFAWWLYRPLGALEQGMARVAAGDLRVRLDRPRRLDEFDALVDRFNAMVDGLREREKMSDALGLASHVQRHLLPQDLPAVPGYELAHAVVYCDQTGGDALDCFPVDAEHRPTRFGLSVGDVSGHGIAAAMLMSWSRATLRAYAQALGDRPHELLDTMNRSFARDAPSGTFLTFFYGVLDPATHAMHWASAGHEPALHLCARTGAVRPLSSTGVPLGVVEDLPIALGEPIAFNAGDLLFIGTDGVRESRSPAGKLLGFDALAQILRAVMHKPLAEIREAIVRAAAEHRGGAPQNDDLTFLLLRRTAAT